VAHVLVNALSLRPGGGLQVIMGLLSSFSDKNCYTVIWSDRRSYKILSEALSHQTNVTFQCPLGEVGNAKTFAWQMLNLRDYAKKNDADLVLSVNHHFPMVNIPQVVYHLSMLRFDRPEKPIWAAGELQDRLRDWRSAKAIKLAAANVLESNYLKDLVETNLGKINNPLTVYIGLRDSVLDDIALRKTVKPEYGPTILAMTSPQPHKDNPTLIKMLAELVGQRGDINWRLRIAGGRPGAFDDLQALAENAGIAERVEWLGFTSHEDLAKIAAECLCLVTPSLKESFCMVALEAMSWGCPTIVADTTSMPESIGDAGILAEPGDARDFAEKVIQLHDNASLRSELVEAGYQHASVNTWSAAAKKFEETFEAVLAG